MADCDTLKSSNDLRLLKTCNLLNSRGKGKATYYVAGYGLSTAPQELSAPVADLSTLPQDLSTLPQDLSTLPQDLSTLPQDLSTPPQDLSAPAQEILNKIKSLKKREHDKSKVETIILDLCNLRPMKASEIAGYFQKEESYFKRKYLSTLISDKKLKYVHPEMINHPAQAYLTNNRG